MPRSRGLSVRMKLTLSYAGVIMLTGALLLAVVWVFLLRYVPAEGIFAPTRMLRASSLITSSNRAK